MINSTWFDYSASEYTVSTSPLPVLCLHQSVPELASGFTRDTLDEIRLAHASNIAHYDEQGRLVSVSVINHTKNSKIYVCSSSNLAIDAYIHHVYIEFQSNAFQINWLRR